MKKIFIAAFLLLGGSILLNGQDKLWTLQECINYAKENNINLKRQELNTEITKKDFSQSRLNALPNLNANFSHNLGAGSILDENSYDYVNTISQGTAGLSSSITLFSGFQGYNAIRMSKAAYLASLETLKYSENRLLVQVVDAYLNLMKNQELLAIAEEKVSLTDLQVERMEMMMELGTASKGDLLQVKAQASNEKYNMLMAKNAVKEAKLHLQQSLNLPVEDQLSIMDPEVAEPDIVIVPELIDVYEAALTQMPEVKGAEYNIDYYSKNLAHARGYLSPSVTARANLSSRYNLKADPISQDPPDPFEQQLIDNKYNLLSIGVSIPIFNQWQARTHISKAKINLMDANYLLEDTKQQMLTGIQTYHNEANAALESYLSARESVANNEEAFTYTNEKFRVGLASALELEVARNNLFEARSQLVTSKYIFHFYVKILQFYMGNDIIF